MSKAKDPNKVKQGKINRRIGADLEKRTRKDLEKKGWMVSKYQNNVELVCAVCGAVMSSKEKKPYCKKCKQHTEYVLTKAVPAKMGMFRSNQGGYSDFLAYRYELKKVVGRLIGVEKIKLYEIVFIECKTNGQLDKLEKEKAEWYLKNNFCSKFLIAYRTKEKNRIKVNYKEFKISTKNEL